MVLSLVCAGCRKPLLLGEEFTGKQVKCPACGHLQVAAGPDKTAPLAERPLPPAEPSPPRLELTDDDDVEDVLLAPGQEAIAPRPPSRQPPPPRPRRRRRREDDVAEVACPYCQGFIPADEESCPECGEDLDDEEVERMYLGLKNQRDFQSALSLVFGIVGLLLLLAPGALDEAAKGRPIGTESVRVGIALVGLVLLCVGFGFAAVCRGHSPALALLGLLCLVGLVILLVLLLTLPDDKGRRLLRLKNFLRERKALGF